MERKYNLLTYLEKRKLGLVRTCVQPKVKRRLISVQKFYPSKQAARSDLKGEILLGFLQDGIHLVSYRKRNREDQSICTLTIWETDIKKIFRRINSYDLFQLENEHADLDMTIASYTDIDRLVIFGSYIFPVQQPCQCLCAILYNPINSNDSYSLTFQFELHTPYPTLALPSALRDKDQVLINTGIGLVSICLKQDSASGQEDMANRIMKDICYKEKNAILKLDISTPRVFSNENLNISSSSQSPTTDTQYLTQFKLKRSINSTSKCENPQNIHSKLHIHSIDLESLLYSLLEKEIEHFKALTDYDVQTLDKYPQISAVYILLAVKIQRFDLNSPPNGLFNKYYTYTECRVCKILWIIPTNDLYLIGGLNKFNDIEYINEKPFWNPGPKLVLEHSPQKRSYFSFHNQHELYYLSNRSVLTGISLLGLRNPCLPICLTL